MTSSVSSLTSRIGSIGSSIGNSMTAGPKGRRMAGGGRGPPNVQQQPRRGQFNPGQQQLRGATRPDARQQQPQQHPAKKETRAPPMSELYSVSKRGEEDSRVDTASPHFHQDVDTSDGEEEEHSGNGAHLNNVQHEVRESPQSPTTANMPDNGIPPQRRQQPAGRRFSPSTPLQKPIRNGGSITPSATRRRYQGHDYNYDDHPSSVGRKLKSALQGAISIPLSVPKKLFKRSAIIDDDGAWSDDEAKNSASYNKPPPRRGGNISRSSYGNNSKPSIIPRPVTSLLQKRDTSLLSSEVIRKCTIIGRMQGILDIVQVSLVAVILQEVIPTFFRALSATLPSSIGDTTNNNSLRIAIISTVLSTLDNGWATYALVAAFLLSLSNKVWIAPSLQSTYQEASVENAADVAYTQLYLRLISSLPMRHKSISEEFMRRLARAGVLQFASLARLHCFVTIAVLYLLLSTVAILRPTAAAVLSSLVQVTQLLHSAWKGGRPIEWGVVLEGAKGAGVSLGSNLRILVDTEWNIVRQEPLRVAVVVSLLLALVSAASLPLLEGKRGKKTGNANQGGRGNNNEGDNEEEENDDIISVWSNIGASSATRLGLLSSPRGVEGALEQFAKLRPDRAAAAGIVARKKSRRHHCSSPSAIYLKSTLQPLLRRMVYATSSVLLLLVPLAIYFYLFASSSTIVPKVDMDDGTALGLPFLSSMVFKSIPEHAWVALSQLATLLLATHLQVGTAVNDAIQLNAIRMRQSVTSFLKKLVDTVEEVQTLANESSAGADFQAMLTASPTKGISVVDLWVAHSSRRAWAVKGANIQCQNGEVVLILGPEGSGKSRLLTAIAEHVLVPPKQARTTTYVRGSVTVAGVDLSKWDKRQLQNRVGVLLNDVRTVSDCASLMAGCTLEEILEPPLEGRGRIGPKERNAVAVAMKITGFGSNLISRFPSKLSTVVSANEDELKPSPLRPPSYPLSPSDWSRLLLTKTLAQLIAGNDQQLSSPDNIRTCMLGSILLLDDAASQMSEVDEAHLISSLRSTGAAVLLTSNRWASGRFADRIIVMDGTNGSVVESGTHEELMYSGPERSLYAKQWSEMMSQA